MNHHFIKTVAISVMTLTPILHGVSHAAHHESAPSHPSSHDDHRTNENHTHEHRTHEHPTPHSPAHSPSNQGGATSPHDAHSGHSGHSGHGEGGSNPLFHHGFLSISQSDRIPTVTVVVHPDERKGWNLEIQTDHFTFAPEQVNQPHQPNYGHGHLYVDGVKVTRLYGHWYYLETLTPGTHEITVSLHANGHELLVHDGDAIADTVTIEIPASAE